MGSGEGPGSGGRRQDVRCRCSHCGYLTTAEEGAGCNRMDCPLCGSRMIGRGISEGPSKASLLIVAVLSIIAILACGSRLLK